ncbi:MAG: hypothetical protein AAFP98_10025 [Pseudomonadota bacterium]
MIGKLKTAVGAALTMTTLAGTASAACLNEEDMRRGIIVTFDNQSSVAMRRTPSGMVEVTETYAAEDLTIKFTGEHGLYFTEEVTMKAARPEDTSRLEIIFDTSSAELPKPEVGTFWSGSTLNIFADGDVRSELYDIFFLDAPKTRLSGCDYETIHAVVEYRWPDDDYGVSLLYAYLPALDAAYILASSSGIAETTLNVPVAIEPATF